MYYFINKIKKFINKVLKNSLISTRGFKKIEEADKCNHQYPITHRMYDKKEKGGIYRYCMCIKCKTIYKHPIDTETYSITKSRITPKKLLKDIQRLDSRFLSLNWFGVQTTVNDMDGFIWDSFFSKLYYSDCVIKSGHVIVWTNRGIVHTTEASSGKYYVINGKRVYDNSVKIFLDHELHQQAVETERKPLVEV